MFCEDNQETYEDFAVLEVNRNRDYDESLIAASAAGKTDPVEGPQVDSVPLLLYKIRVRMSMKLASATLHNCSSDIISYVRTIKLRMNVNEVEAVLEFFVTKRCRPAILGLKTCRMCGLVRCMEAIRSAAIPRNAIVMQFP